MDRKRLIYGAVGAVVVGQVLIWVYRTTKTSLMLRKARRHCAEIRAKRPQLPSVSMEIKEKVLSLTATELVQEMKSGGLRCEDVMATYIERAYTIGHDLNLTAEEVFEEALAAARAADKQRSEQPGSLGSLFGLPVSIKDHISQKGCTSSCGVIHKRGKVDDMDSHLVEIIRASGGIPFVRSNVPQIMLWVETESHTFGRAENPWNRSRTTGGSSGGEAGLVAARCSPLGVGSDIGGSIRYPCASCGLYGLKPTPQRVRFSGINFAHKDNTCSMEHIIPPAVGPLARCTDDIALLLRAWWQPSTFETDPTLIPLSFNDSLYQAMTSGQKLRIGYYTQLEGIPAPASCMTRIMNEACEALRAQGHELVEFHIPSPYNIGKRYYQAMMLVGPRETQQCLQGEPAVWFNQPVLDVGESQMKLKFILFLLKMMGYGRFIDMLDYKIGLDSREMNALYLELNNYTAEVARIWNEQKLDAVISPLSALPAFPHRGSELMTIFLVNQIIANSIQFPAGVVPAGRVQPGEDHYDSPVQDTLTTNAKKVMKDSVGLPIGIQVTALPYEDEKALGVMKLLEGIFHFHEHPI